MEDTEQAIFRVDDKTSRWWREFYESRVAVHVNICSTVFLFHFQLLIWSMLNKTETFTKHNNVYNGQLSKNAYNYDIKCSLFVLPILF